MTAYTKALDAEMLPIDVAKTRVAILGTLGALHAEPVAYDLACLRSLIEGLEPDLLGVELEPAAWESGDLGAGPLEVRQALLPAARRTDTVVVPLGGPSPDELAPPEGGGLARVRTNLMRATDVLLTHFQQIAATPEAVNSSAFSHLCGMVCGLEEMMASQAGKGRMGRNQSAHTGETSRGDAARSRPTTAGRGTVSKGSLAKRTAPTTLGHSYPDPVSSTLVELTSRLSTGPL